MDLNKGYVLLALTALGIVLVILTAMGRVGHKYRRLSTLGGIAFSLVIAGVVFDENRGLGFSLLGAGVLVAALDAMLRLRDRS